MLKSWSIRNSMTFEQRLPSTYHQNCGLVVFGQFLRRCDCFRKLCRSSGLEMLAGTKREPIAPTILSAMDWVKPNALGTELRLGPVSLGQPSATCLHSL